MTCIAWDGKELCGDRQGDWNGTLVRVKKVFRVRGKDGRVYLLGGAGDLDSVLAYIHWQQGKAEKPQFKDTDNMSVILVNDRGQPFLVNKSCIPVRIYQRQVAVGAARGEALAAMMAGKSGRQAIRIAARLETSVGCGVDAVRI